MISAARRRVNGTVRSGLYYENFTALRCTIADRASIIGREVITVREAAAGSALHVQQREAIFP
jgi:hypothetical protein